MGNGSHESDTSDEPPEKRSRVQFDKENTEPNGEFEHITEIEVKPKRLTSIRRNDMKLVTSDHEILI